jgi:galacturan 1,4-alpha-galacturonidase
MAFISSAAMKAAVAALLVFAAVSPAARAVAAEAEAKAKAVGGAPSVPAGSLDIAQLGAKGDGKSDSTPMVLKAWKHACEATGQQKIVIPKGNYLTGALDLVGPCKSSIIIRLDGNLLGTGDLNAYKRNWIEIQNVDNLSINGHGTIDGQGALVWNKNECQRSYNCKILPNVRACASSFSVCPVPCFGR